MHNTYLHDLLAKLFGHVHKLRVAEHAVHGLKVLGRVGCTSRLHSGFGLCCGAGHQPLHALLQGLGHLLERRVLGDLLRHLHDAWVLGR